MKTKLHYVLTIAMLLFVFSSFSQNSTWRKVESIKKSENLAKFQLYNNKVHVFELDLPSFKKSTASATLRGISNKQANTMVSIPAMDGKMETFKIYKTSVFAPELAAKYPNIKSYVGISTNHAGTHLRMSVSPQGVQTMISNVGKPTVFMQPIAKGSNKYVLYNKGDKSVLTDKFECKTINKLNRTFNKNNSKTSRVNEGGANNQTLQKFRLAVSTTSEYTAYHDDGNPGNGDDIADALAAINASINRVNEIYETDMAITFEVIANTDLVIFNDASTDPYSPANTGSDGAWNSEIQNTLTSLIGESNYDIGHLFGASGGGGNAGCIGCVCQNNLKGSAFTSPSNGIPETDTFDIDFVAHEIGHQMGANHTWAFESEGEGVNSEPGSGSTIMGYAGIEGANNVELKSDAYFHYYSIKQVLDNVSSKSCQTTDAILNESPSANAGNNYNIPKGTAYILKGTATDNNGDNLTYCWEQIDSGITNYLNFDSGLTSGSTNRSLPPSNSSDRYIPRFSSVVAGNTTQTNPTLGSDWETVSTVARTLNWALTVRDRDPSSATGGQSSFDTMQITVEDVAPFTVTNPFSWPQGSSQTIEWEVGQTNNGTINCQNVNIKLSTDGGLTFPTTIASNAPNIGTFAYTVPAIPNTNNARILIEAADNVFYDVSDFNFPISTEPDFFITEETLLPINCGETSATFTFNYVAVNGFSQTTAFSVSSRPGSSTVAFLPASLNNSGSVTMIINNLDGVTEGNYPLTITGTSTSITKNKNVDLPFSNGLCRSIANIEFRTSTTLVVFNTINNPSGKPSGYSDYTSISTNVNRNTAYNLTVNANTDDDFITNTTVWIDWNQNCSFDDVGEAYNLGQAENVSDGITSKSALSITIPIDAVLGSTTMRVTTKFEGDFGGELPIACENGFDGEVEDYTLNIMPSDSEYETSITLVQFNTIDQTSLKPSDYSDYSSVLTEINRDSSYDLNVHVNTEGDFTTATKVWIDWNQNSSFNDAGEVYDLGNITNVSDEPTNNSPFSIKVPIDAVLGNTIMRLATKYIGDLGEQEPTPFDNGLDGEIEDYTLNIMPTLEVEEFGFDNLSIYPNPNKGEFTIKLSGSNTRNIQTEIYDIRGQVISKNTYKATGDFKELVDLKNIQSGLYLLVVSDGLKRCIKKIIIE